MRNLLAFEQCHYNDEKAYFKDYVFFVGSLFDTFENVDLIVKYLILNNWGDNSEIANLIKKLRDGVAIDFEEFYFVRSCDKLNRYCMISWHNWMETLKQKYFKTPWAIISIIGVGILIKFTFIQAVCSILFVPK